LATHFPIAVVDKPLDVSRDSELLLRQIGLAILPVLDSIFRIQRKSLSAQSPIRLLWIGHDVLLVAQDEENMKSKSHLLTGIHPPVLVSTACGNVSG
jgi:hypothetical protein